MQTPPTVAFRSSDLYHQIILKAILQSESMNHIVSLLHKHSSFLPCLFVNCSGAERAAAPQHSSGASGLHRRGLREGAPGHHAGAHLLLHLLLLCFLLKRLCHHVAAHYFVHVHHLLCHPPTLRQSPEQPPLHGQPHDGRDLRQAGARGR